MYGLSINSIPFLDTIVMPQPDGSIKTTVYRKPTHTDMYLHWDSYHPMSAKFSIINTLRHRSKTVCSNSQLLKEKEDHLNKVLRRCKYPMWALNRVNVTQNKKKNKEGASKNSNTSIKKPYIIVPYIQGMSESCKNICRKHGVECISKEEVPSKTSWYTQRTRITYYRRVEWSTGTNVEGWTVMKSTLDSQAGLLEKGSESTWGHLPPSLTITTSLVMRCLWTISA